MNGGERVDAVRRAVLERQLAGLVKEHIEYRALGRGQYDLLNELLVLDVATVPADELHPCARQRNLEGAGVRGVREVEAHDLAELRVQRQVRLAVDQQHLAETPHCHMCGLRAAERRDLPVLEQDVVEGQREVPVGRRPVVRVGWLDQHVAVEAELLAVVLADVRVVPVGAGIRKRDPRREALADLHRRLRLVRAVIAVLEPQPVPVDGGLHVALVLDIDDDLRALPHLEDRSGDRIVVGEHPHGVVAEALRDRSDTEVELVAVRELDPLRRLRLGQTLDVGGEMI